MGKKRLSYDFVYDKFKERGYTLLSTEYINSRELLKYLCPIHGEQQISYTSLEQLMQFKEIYISKSQEVA